MGAFFPNQRPSTKDLDNAKRMREQSLQDQREQAARQQARQFAKDTRAAVDKMKKINKTLEHFAHDHHHKYERDHQSMHGAEELDHLAHEIEQAAAGFHTEIQHSPMSGTKEFQEAQHGDHGAAALFQLIAACVILLRRLKDLEPEKKKSAKKEGLEAKGLVAKLRALVKKK